jgi:hypothetical protein
MSLLNLDLVSRWVPGTEIAAYYQNQMRVLMGSPLDMGPTIPESSALSHLNNLQSRNIHTILRETWSAGSKVEGGGMQRAWWSRNPISFPKG